MALLSGIDIDKDETLVEFAAVPTALLRNAKLRIYLSNSMT
jgi:hypothetical protein